MNYHIDHAYRGKCVREKEYVTSESFSLGKFPEEKLGGPQIVMIIHSKVKVILWNLKFISVKQLQVNQNIKKHSLSKTPLSGLHNCAGYCKRS